MKHVIADARKFRYTTNVGLQERIAGQMLSELNKTGSRKYAHIHNEELVSELSVEQLFEENKMATSGDRFFDNEVDAREWILGT